MTLRSFQQTGMEKEWRGAISTISDTKVTLAIIFIFQIISWMDTLKNCCMVMGVRSMVRFLGNVGPHATFYGWLLIVALPMSTSSIFGYNNRKTKRKRKNATVTL